jgi:hypothetical protein
VHVTRREQAEAVGAVEFFQNVQKRRFGLDNVSMSRVAHASGPCRVARI